jgi:protein TonB
MRLLVQVALAIGLTPILASAQASSMNVADAKGDRPYFEFQVEKPAAAKMGNPHPQYPAALQSRGINGEVLAQFVVDTTGKADVSTFEVVKSTNESFTAAVKDVLPRMRFYPAEVGGKKVKQLVEQSFLFVASK